MNFLDNFKEYVFLDCFLYLCYKIHLPAKFHDSRSTGSTYPMTDRRTDRQQSDPVRVPFFILRYGTLKIVNESINTVCSQH